MRVRIEMSCDTPSNWGFLLPYHCVGAGAAVIFFPPDPPRAQRTVVVSVRNAVQSA